MSGASAGNYTLTQPGGLTANIAAAGVAIASGVTANNKVYDRTTAATLNFNNVVLSGVIAGDVEDARESTGWEFTREPAHADQPPGFPESPFTPFEDIFIPHAINRLQDFSSTARGGF